MRIDQVTTSGEAIDRLDGLVLLLRSDGSIVDANSAALDCYGYSHDEMLALNIHDLRAPGDQDDIDRAMRKAAQRGVLFETAHRRKDGSQFPVEVRAIPVSVDGEVALLGLVRDVSERVQGERQLRESESRYRALAEGSPLAVFINRNDKDDDEVVLANPACVNLFGASSPEDLIGRSAMTLFHPDSQTRVRGLLREATTSLSLDEVRVVRLDGTSVDVAIDASPLLDQGVAAIQVVLRDITERKRAEEATRKDEAELKEAQRIGQFGNFDWDARTDAIAWSDGYYRIYGFDPNQAPPGYEEHLRTYSPESAARLDAAVTMTMRTGEPYVLDVEQVRQGGTRKWFHVRAEVKRDADNTIIGLRGTAQDITERKQSEEELARQKGRIAETLTSVIDIAGDIVEARDPYTAGHQRRVSELATKIAQGLGMSDLEVGDIRVASLLHDVGKVSVPTEILSKPGRLSEPEFELVKGHAAAGRRIVASAQMREPIAELVYQHHERCDGSGYPRGLIGDEILPGAKVIAVADVVEAMASHRPYRAALGTEAGLAEIERGAGSLYDAEVSKACVALFREAHFELSPQPAGISNEPEFEKPRVRRDRTSPATLPSSRRATKSPMGISSDTAPTA